LEGHELRIIEQGHTDSADTTSLHVPSIGLIVAGDVVYNECHMYVGDTTPENRKNWVAALDGLATLKPAIVVAGHKKPGAPDSPSAIQDTKRYLLDFDRLQQTTASDEELFNQMTEPGDDDYNRNIQIADLNALNAALAVIKWKKLFGFYRDLKFEHHSQFSIDTNLLLNEDRPNEAGNPPQA
ncbi:MAG: hypothetical protein WBW05_01660, partial [Candidatus Acidiferrum sp.]